MTTISHRYLKWSYCFIWCIFTKSYSMMTTGRRISTSIKTVSESLKWGKCRESVTLGDVPILPVEVGGNVNKNKFLIIFFWSIKTSSGTAVIQWEECKRILARKLWEKCRPRDIEKVCRMQCDAAAALSFWYAGWKVALLLQQKENIMLLRGGEMCRELGRYKRQDDSGGCKLHGETKGCFGQFGEQTRLRQLPQD